VPQFVQGHGVLLDQFDQFRQRVAHALDEPKVLRPDDRAHSLQERRPLGLGQAQLHEVAGGTHGAWSNR
jgi:hypothetical protein